MIRVLVLICSVQNLQASFPSFAEIKSRTRWCLVEGAHCPINLPFKIRSCCQPYVCSEVPKTRKPTMFLKFTSYTDHRCLLPSAVFGNVTNSTNEQTIITVGNPQQNEEHSAEFFNKNTVTNVTSEEFFSRNQSETFDEYQSMPTEEINQTEENEVYEKQVVKRSVASSSEYAQQRNYIKESGSEETSSEDSGDPSGHNFDNLSQRDNESYVNSTDYYNDYYDGNNTIPVPNNYLDEVNSMETPKNEGSLIKENIVHTNISTARLEFLKSTEDSVEDWHSSQMVYDTRPMLRKTVAVEAFHLFQSPEVIRLNESIEVSE